jgi:cell division septation protein DedD
VPSGAAAPALDAASTYAVHLGSFRLRREADAEVARLQELGFEARWVHVNVPEKGPWYRVVVGEFATFAEAQESALVLRESTGRTRPNIVGAGGYGAPVPVPDQSESPGKATP